MKFRIGSRSRMLSFVYNSPREFNACAFLSIAAAAMGISAVMTRSSAHRNALIGLDAENRNRLRQWLDRQDSTCASDTIPTDTEMK
jgi:hypothetical protein